MANGGLDHEEWRKMVGSQSHYEMLRIRIEEQVKGGPEKEKMLSSLVAMARERQNLRLRNDMYLQRLNKMLVLARGAVEQPLRTLKRTFGKRTYIPEEE